MQEIDIKTKEGVADGYAFYPEGKEELTPVVLYMDIFGAREALFRMAERISGWGFYVLVPNLFYREGRGIHFSPQEAFQSEESKKEIFGIMQSLTMEQVMVDTKSYLNYLEEQGNTAGKAACIGYCMGGKYALAAAGRFPGHVGAAALFHATRLATDRPDSPHLLIPKIKGVIYMGIAGIDPHFGEEEEAVLKQTFDTHRIEYKMEIYPDVKHGFSVPDTAAYDQTASERHFKVLHAFLEQYFHPE